MLEAMNTGRTVKLLGRPVVAFGHQAAWWLGVHWWLGLCLGFGLHLRPQGVMLIGAAAASGGRFFTSSTCSSVQLPQHTVSCGALHYFFALVKLDFVPTAGVSVTASGFVGAKGSVGTTMSGRLVFREEIAVLPGRHRPVQQQACFFVVANSS